MNPRAVFFVDFCLKFGIIPTLYSRSAGGNRQQANDNPPGGGSGVLSVFILSGVEVIEGQIKTQIVNCQLTPENRRPRNSSWLPSFYHDS